MIKSKALVVISKSYCPFCHKVIIFFPICITIQTLIRCYGMMIYQAKAALNNYKINPDNFEWLEIEDREDCNEIQVFRFFLMMQAWEHFFSGLHEAVDWGQLCAESFHRRILYWRRWWNLSCSQVCSLFGYPGAGFKIVISALITIISRSGKLEGMLKEAGALL